MTFERLWKQDGVRRRSGTSMACLEPSALEVLSWIPGGAEPQFMPVMCLTRRDYAGEIVELRTKMGRRSAVRRITPGWSRDGAAGELVLKPAGAPGARRLVAPGPGHAPMPRLRDARLGLGAVEAAAVHPSKVIVRLGRERAAALAARPIAERREIFAGHVAAGRARSGGPRPCASTKPGAPISM